MSDLVIISHQDDNNKGLSAEWTYTRVVVYTCDRCGCDFDKKYWPVCPDCWQQCDLCKLYFYAEEVMEGDLFCGVCTKILREGEKEPAPLHEFPYKFN